MTADSTNRRATDQFVTLLRNHTQEEMDRYNEIIKQIGTNDESSIERHNDTQRRLDSLTDSIDSFVAETSEFHSAVRRAFPKDDEGRPNYDGHRREHLSWISDAKESKELKRYIQKVVLGAAAIAVGSWISMLIWQGILHGPVGK